MKRALAAAAALILVAGTAAAGTTQEAAATGAAAADTTRTADIASETLDAASRAAAASDNPGATDGGAPEHAAAEPRDPARCLELGFTEELLCTTCDRMRDVVGDEALTHECLACCTKPEAADNGAAAVQYSFARLVYDSRALGAYPELANFLKTTEKFPQLQVERYMGAVPTLLTYAPGEDTDGPPSQVLRVDQWPADALAEYLREHVIAADTTASVPATVES